MTKPKPGVSRRTVVKGTAWAVPAVVVATATPAMAASPCLTATFGGDSCKQPGTGQNMFGYRLGICFTNHCTTAATITVTSVASDTGNPIVQPVNQTITVQPGATGCLPNDVIYCSNSSANYINVFFTVGGSAQSLRVASPPQNCSAGTVLCATP